MEANFIRVRSAKDIIITTSLFVLGALLITSPTSASINLVGFFMIFAGMLTAFTLMSGHKLEGTGEKYRKKEYYFLQEMNPVILSALESKPDSIDLTQVDKGRSIRLDVYYSKSTGEAYLQLFEYIPYRYEPCSKTYEHEVEKVYKLIK